MNKLVYILQNVYLREVPPPSNEKMSYQWDIPIVMVSQDNLNFSQLQPNIWMTKGGGDSSITTKDTVEKEKFIIVNPEEIGKLKEFIYLNFLITFTFNCKKK